MRRKLVSRRVARFTPAMIEARRRMFELDGAVKACREASDVAYKRAWTGESDYSEFHRLIAPPCGESCACHLSNEARALMDSEFRKFGITPWDIHGETEH